MAIEYKGHQICDCDCHKEGVQLLHMMACCNLCYDTYLDKDGNIIPEKLDPLLNETSMETFQRQTQQREEENINRYVELVKSGEIEDKFGILKDNND